MVNGQSRGCEARPAGIAKRAWLVLLAAVLCLGLAPSLSWAAVGSGGGHQATANEETADQPSGADETSQGVVTLTITTGSKTDYATGEVTYPTWVNQQYTVQQVADAAAAEGGTGHAAGQLTMQDLLDTAVRMGDISSYGASASPYGGLSLDSITSKDGAKLAWWNSEDSSASLYWSVYDDGAYAQTSFDGVALKAGGTYQLAWASFSTASAPADWKAFYQENPATPVEGAADVVALTVTTGSKTDYTTGKVTYPTWVNKEYAISDVEAVAKAEGGTGHAVGELTMEDVLDAAVAAGDLSSYDASKSEYGLYLNSITSKDGAKLAGWNTSDNALSQYWSIYENGSYAQTSFDAVKVKAGGSYQFAWATYSTAAAPSDWKAFYEGNPAAKPGFARGYEDVDQSMWYVPGIDFSAEKGLIIGYAGTKLFGVGDPLTRAQLAVILCRQAGADVADPESAANETGMPDVESGAYYTAAANWAVKNGVINGVEEADGSRTFRPNDPVTTEQLLAMLANDFGGDDLSKDDHAALDRFTDRSAISDWAVDSTAWAANVGLVNGVENPDGTRSLHPTEVVARERAASFFLNASEVGIL